MTTPEHLVFGTMFRHLLFLSVLEHYTAIHWLDTESGRKRIVELIQHVLGWTSYLTEIHIGMELEKR